MSIFTYHLVVLPIYTSLKLIFLKPNSRNIKGLIHAEYMTEMILGSSVFSPKRLLFRRIVIFAQWENEKAIDSYLTQNSLGKKIARGWHLRLLLTRQWGKISKFKIDTTNLFSENEKSPVVAVTIARMKFLEIPRFIKWGKPVEKLVRDHKGTVVSTASIRFPRTVSTFSIWKNKQEMTDMVFGHNSMPKPKRHFDAMNERDKKDFHLEFTTLRFKAIAEYGEYNGKSDYLVNFIQNI